MDYNVDNILASFFGGMIIFGIIILLFFLPLIIVEIIALWKLFTKAGKPGWASIIPIYNNFVLMEIAGLNWWWFLLIISNSVFIFLGIDGLASIASIASLIANFNCYYNISKKFNKDNTFAIFAGIFNFIFVLILGLSKKEVYDNNISVGPNGIFDQPKDNNSNYNMNNNMYSQNNNSVVNEQINNSESISFCGNCGTKLNANDRFCPNCGTKK